MLLFVGFGELSLNEGVMDAEVNILDTDDMVVESIDKASLKELLSNGVITLGNTEILNSSRVVLFQGGVLPDGLYIELGCGDIWYTADDKMFIWNNVTKSVYSLGLSSIYRVSQIDKGYRIGYISAGLGSLFGDVDFPMCDDGVCSINGKFISKGMFKRKVSLGLLQELV